MLRRRLSGRDDTGDARVQPDQGVPMTKIPPTYDFPNVDWLIDIWYNTGLDDGHNGFTHAYRVDATRIHG